jgi:hypothetical protein
VQLQRANPRGVDVRGASIEGERSPIQFRFLQGAQRFVGDRIQATAADAGGGGVK